MLEKQDGNKEVFMLCTYDGGYVCGGGKIELKSVEELEDRAGLTANSVVLYNDEC